MKKTYNNILSLVFVMLLFAANTAMAQEDITYLDETDAELTVTATKLTAGQTSITTGWYYVEEYEDVTIDKLNVEANVQIIISDYASLEVAQTISLSPGTTLTFYSQSRYGDGVGKLVCPNSGQTGYFFAGSASETLNLYGVIFQAELGARLRITNYVNVNLLDGYYLKYDDSYAAYANRVTYLKKQGLTSVVLEPCESHHGSSDVDYGDGICIYCNKHLDSDFYYKVIKNTSTEKHVQIGNGTNCAWVSSSLPENNTIRIPKTITHNGTTYTVTKIANNAFKNFNGGSTLETVTFPDPSVDFNLITTIGKNAFADNTSLKNVNLEACGTLETIGEGAFSNTALTSVTIASVVKEIGASAFKDCNNLENVAFSNYNTGYLKTIGDYAFYETAITEIQLTMATGGEINDATIGSHAFSHHDATEDMSFTLICNSRPAPAVAADAFCDVISPDNRYIYYYPCADYSAFESYFGDNMNSYVFFEETELSGTYDKVYDGTVSVSGFTEKTFTPVTNYTMTVKSLEFLNPNVEVDNSDPTNIIDKKLKAVYDLSTTGCSTTDNKIILKNTTAKISPRDITKEEIESIIISRRTAITPEDYYVRAQESCYDGDDNVLDGDIKSILSIRPDETVKFYMTAQYVDAEGHEPTAPANAQKIKITPGDYTDFTDGEHNPTYNYKLADSYDIDGGIGEFYGYVERSSDGKTLTFKYGEIEDPAYELNTVGWAADKSTVETVVFDMTFKDARPTSCNSWFKEFTELQTITGIEYLYTSDVTDMTDMFNGCSQLSSIDVSRFNTENVTAMGGMFKDCSSLTTLDLRSFNTAKVENMSSMFEGCSSLTAINVSDVWNVNAVTSSTDMFKNCTSLAGGNGTGYSPSYTDHTYARSDDPDNGKPGYFTGTKIAYAVISPENQSLTFKYDYYYTDDGQNCLLNMGVDNPNWYMAVMNIPIKSVVFEESFQDARPTSCYKWFANGANIESITGLEYLNTSEVTNMSGMFSNCDKLTSLDLASFNTGQVTDMSDMFYSCDALTTIIVGNGWNTNRVASSNQMFSDCANLKGGSGTEYDENKTDVAYAHIDGGTSNQGYFSNGLYAVLNNGTLTFKVGVKTSESVSSVYDVPSDGSDPKWLDDKASITKVVFHSSFDNARPVNCKNWFNGCSSLTEFVDMQYLHTDRVTDMSYMFNGCSAVKVLYLKSFNTGNVADMSCMFQEMSNLKAIYVDGDAFVVPSEATIMFYGCTKLVGGAGTTVSNSYISGARAKIDGVNYESGYFTDVDTYGYAVFSNGTLTFKKGPKPSDAQGLVYELFVDDTPEWSAKNADITTVEFKDGFSDVTLWSCQKWFSGCKNLTSIIGLTNIKTTIVTDMSYMFNECEGLKVLDLSNFKTLQVRYMNYMFAGCTNLTTIKVDSEKWSTASVTSVGKDHVFQNDVNIIGNGGTVYNADDDANNNDFKYARIDNNPSSFSGYLSTGNYKIFYRWADDDLIEYHDYTPSEFDGTADVDIENPVTRADGASFGYWTRVTPQGEEPSASSATLNITAGDLGNRIYMMHWNVVPAYAVYEDGTLTFKVGDKTSETGTVYNLPKDGNDPVWLENNSAITKVVFHSSFDEASPINCKKWFYECSSLAEIEGMEYFHTGEVTDMSYMFYGCSSLTVLDLNSFVFSKVANMEWMFAGCGNLTTILVNESQLNSSDHSLIRANTNSQDNVFAYCYSIIGNTGTLYNIADDAYYKNCYYSGWHYICEYKNDIGYANAGDGGYLTTGKYKIFYDLDVADDNITLEDVDGADTEYEGGSVVTLPELAASVENGAFKYWVRTSLFANGFDEVSSIAATEKGNRIFSAKWANSKERYVVYESGNNTLYFKFDAEKPESGVYSLNGVNTTPAWVEEHKDDIENVVFEAEFAPLTCYQWFAGCSNLMTLDLTNLKTDKLSNTESMFDGCSNLNAILVDQEQWYSSKRGKISKSDNMFSGCTSLIGEYGVFVDEYDLGISRAYAKEDDYEIGYFTCDNFKIFYDLDGGNFEDDNINSPIEYDAEIELETPTQDGYTFLGWAKAIGYEEYEYIYDTELLTDPTIPANSGNYYLKAVWGEPYAELSEDGKTLTFKVGVKPEDDYNCFDLPTDNSTPDWVDYAKSTVETVVFESTITPVSCKQWFANFSELKEIKDMDIYLNTENVQSYSGMFAGCTKLQSIDVSYFTPAEDYGWMFSGCEQLQTITLGNIVNETANDIEYMFHDCSSLEEINVSGFNTTNVKDMSYLFDDCRSLKSVNVSNFSTDNVTDMSYMFSACKSLKVLDISNFNTAAVTNMSWMFADCDNLTTIRVGDGWTTSKINTTNSQTQYTGWNLFRFDYALIGNDGTFCNVREYGTDPYIDYQYAHANDGGYLTKGNYKIFYDKDAGDDKIQIETIDGAPTEYVSANGIEELPTLEESDENGEFNYWVSITRSADEIVTGPSANSIAAGEIGNKIYSAKWALSKEKYVYYDDDDKTLYFRFDAHKPAGAYSLNNGSEAPGWLEHSNDIENIVIEGEIAPTSCYQWFKGCYKVKTIDLSNLITDKVTNMESMFEDCSSLTGINIAHFKRDRLTNIKYMFRNCSSLTGILVDPDQWKRYDMWWETDYLESEEMFAGCDMLIGEEGTWAGDQYCDGSCDNDNNPHTDDKRFAFAKPYSECDGGNFTEGNFKIYYDLDGGVLNGESDPDPQEYDDDTELATPTNDGYVLAGWLQAIGYEKEEDEEGYIYTVPTYPDSYDASDLITSIAKNSGNYRLKAVWELPEEYEINLPTGWTAYAADDLDTPITSATAGTEIVVQYTGTTPIKKVEVFPMPQSITITNDNPLTMSVDNKVQLTYTIAPDGVSDEDKNAVTWSSSEETVATVSADGIVEAKGTGETIITAETVNGVTATIKVIVE